MKILSENLASHLVLEVTTPEPLYPILRLFVSVDDEGFSGTYSEVWVSLDDYEKFLADLRLCEQTRRGNATLSSMSPDKFEVTIEQCDGWGHFLLRYMLSKNSRLTGEKRVSGSFGLDASSFKELVEEFDNLINVETPP